MKINVYYDSLNEKGIKEKVDYSLEVRLKLLVTSEMKISQHSGREFLFSSWRLRLPLAWNLFLQVNTCYLRVVIEFMSEV